MALDGMTKDLSVPMLVDLGQGIHEWADEIVTGVKRSCRCLPGLTTRTAS
jgi:hypothetical protein